MRQVLTIGVTLLACAAMVVPALAGTTGDPRPAFIKSCVTQMYYSEAVCTCMADRAEKEIGAAGMAYESLPALDVAQSTSMSKQMTGAERNRIDSFMKNAPRQCGAKN